MPIMNQLPIAIAFCLPAPDIEALNQGRNILVMPRIFMNPGRLFTLYPTDIEFNSLPLEQYYRPGFIPIAKQSLAELNQEKIKIKVWAKCELCQTLNEPEHFAELSKLTVWTEAALNKTLEQRGHIFLAYFRVYRLPQPLEIDPVANSRFISLPASITVDESQAILDDNNFERQYRRIFNRQPPEHPELEELENAIAQLTLTYPDAESLKDQIQTFLGWQPAKPGKISENLNWIYTINQLGTTAEGGNYEKGTAFEKIVHQSLNFLGFELDQNAKGGAGGMDLYCTKPYPMVGECKAGRSLPDSTAEQLYRIGVRHLGIETYEKAVKLIIGPGKPTSYLEKSAQNSIISIINPMTLEKLVKLQAQYPGSVNLFELKDYLQAGQMDDKIDEYIEIVIKRLELRSHIIQLFKKSNQPINLDNVIGAFSFSNPPQPLEREQLKEILIELSSPLTGYLGRTADDRFYFLRELIVDQTESFDYNL
jgi:hypothetical protein